MGDADSWDDFDDDDDIDDEPARPPAMVRKSRAQIAAVIALVLGFAGGCTFGVVTSTPSPTSNDARPVPASEIPRVSPTRITPTPDEFMTLLDGVPVKSSVDAQLTASAACVAFDQNPGTTLDSAAAQLAPQKGWTSAQARRFLEAATSSYCPDHR